MAMIGAWTNKAFSMIETITAAESQRPVQARINILAEAAILHISNYSESIKNWIQQHDGSDIKDILNKIFRDWFP